MTVFEKIRIVKSRKIDVERVAINGAGWWWVDPPEDQKEEEEGLVRCDNKHKNIEFTANSEVMLFLRPASVSS